jgi:Ni/Fe-hydrogenase subunit HybB-like protein
MMHNTTVEKNTADARRLDSGHTHVLFQPSYEMYVFWIELGLSLVLPLFLLLQRSVRTSPGGLYLAAVLVVLGFITNRLNVSITGWEASSHVRYIPKWTEIAVTGAITAAGFMLFSLAVKYLRIFPTAEGVEAEEEPSVAIGTEAVPATPLLEDVRD